MGHSATAEQEPGAFVLVQGRTQTLPAVQTTGSSAGFSPTTVCYHAGCEEHGAFVYEGANLCFMRRIL